MEDDRHAIHGTPSYSETLKERLNDYIVDLTLTSSSLAMFMGKVDPSHFYKEEEIYYYKQITPGPITNPYDIEERIISQWTFIHLLVAQVSELITAPTPILNENQELAAQEIIFNGFNKGLVAIRKIGKDYKVLLIYPHSLHIE